jgi:hypothetical protein
MKRFHFLILFLLEVSFSFSQLKLSFDSMPCVLEDHWKFKAEDNADFASVDCNDSDWKNVDCNLPLNKLKETGFEGFGWFRLHVNVNNQLLNKNIAISIVHLGASEIYLDGNLICRSGKVSVTEQGERRFRTDGIWVPLQFRDTGDHVLAVRYSNHRFNQYRKWDDFYAGFQLYLDQDKNQTYLHFKKLSKINTLLLVVCGFLFALTFIHFFFYVFYRKQKHHLSYSIFTFFFSLFLLLAYFSFNLDDPDITEPCGYFAPLAIPFYFIALAGFMHYLMTDRLPKMFWFSLATGFIIFLGFFFKTGYNQYFHAILIYLVISQIFRALNEGKKKKLKGLGIIRWGFIIFACYVTSFGVQFLLNVFGINNEFFNFGSSRLLLLLPGILSIPVSISLFMAKTFSVMNFDLERQLKELEELSARNLEQEREKQKILSEQNQLLEEKVKERTAEVVKQKEVIEDKQKEILDSIRYARRIQSSLFPKEKIIEKIFSRMRKS